MSARTPTPIEPDMFERAPSEDLANALQGSKIEFTGTLASVEVRLRPIESTGHFEPVICIEIEVDSACPHVVRAERPYQFRQEAERDAALLKKGQRIRVSSPLLGLRIYLPNVEILSSQPTEFVIP